MAENTNMKKPKTKKEILAKLRDLKAENAQLVQDIESYNDNNQNADWIDAQYEFHEKINAEIDRQILSLK